MFVAHRSDAVALVPDYFKGGSSIDAAIPAGIDFDAACKILGERLQSAWNAPVEFVDLRGGSWRLLTAASQFPALRLLVRAVRRTAPRGRWPEANVLRIAGADWTLFQVWDMADRRLFLLLGGDWTASQALLEDAARRVGTLLRPIDSHRGNATARLRAVAALSQRLVHATPADVPQVIAKACARAVGADRGSVALYDPQRNALIVEATYGYSVALVKHLRLRPGAGIIGTVFRNGRPIINAPGGFTLERPRNRYRTRSLIAVPLVGYDDVMGVVSVCDPEGRPSFDRRDLRLLRKLADVGSLALGRVAAQRDAEEHSRRAAVDPLTGLFNRRHFHMRLDEEIERSRRQSSPLALLMLDVDGLKQLNDQLGHPVGDHVLRTVADVLRRSVRLFDVCTRYGGDEFAILMPGAEADSSRQVADRIREGVENFQPSVGPTAGHPLITASIGIATTAGTTAEELIARADEALYTAKRQGRNRVAIA
jgi:diguanylate cyclase (GGDEF)-like protein